MSKAIDDMLLQGPSAESLGPTSAPGPNIDEMLMQGPGTSYTAPNIDSMLGKTTGIRAGTPKLAKIWSGGWLQDIGDALSLPQYWMMHALTGKGVKGLSGERYAPSDWLDEHPGWREQNPVTRTVGGFAADVLADPLNLFAAPVKLAQGGVKAITIGDKAFEGLGAVYKAAGKLGPIEAVALKMAADPRIRWLDNMGFGFTREGRAAHALTSEKRLKTIASSDKAVHKIGQAIKDIPLTPDLDKWTSRYISEGWEMRDSYSRGLQSAKKRERLGSLEELHTRVDDARTAMLAPGSEVYDELLADAGKAGRELDDYITDIKGTAARFIGIDDEWADTARELGVFGNNPEVAKLVQQAWQGGHQKRLFALVGEPGLLAKSLEADKAENIAFAEVLIKAKYPEKTAEEVAEAAEAMVAKQGADLLETQVEKAAKYRSGDVGGITTRAITEERKHLPPLAIKMLHITEAASLQAGVGTTEIATSAVFKKLYDDMAETVASKTAKLDERGVPWKEVDPKNPSFGALKGMYLPETVWHDVMNTTKPMPQIIDDLSKYISSWKRWRTTRLPGVIAGNAVGNAVLAHVAGDLPPWSFRAYWQAMKDVFSPEFMRDPPAHLVNTFNAAEFKDLRPYREQIIRTMQGKGSYPKAYQALKTLAEKVDNSYGMVEGIFKHSVYLNAMSRGMTEKAAGEIAEKALFNYQDVPRAVDILRKSGAVPFITFPYKALPRMAEAAIRNPQRVALYLRKLSGNVEKGIDPYSVEKREAESKQVPEYIGKGFNLRFGKAGQGKYAAVGRYLPVATIENFLPEEGDSNLVGAALQGALSMTGPGVKQLIEWGGRNRLYGQNIPTFRKNESDALTMLEDVKGELIPPLANTFLPTMTPSSLGGGIFKAATGSPQAKRTLPEELLTQAVGPNIFDVVQRAKRKAAMRTTR